MLLTRSNVRAIRHPVLGCTPPVAPNEASSPAATWAAKSVPRTRGRICRRPSTARDAPNDGSRAPRGLGRLTRSLLVAAVERPIALGGEDLAGRRARMAEPPRLGHPAPVRELAAQASGGVNVREKFGETFATTRYHRRGSRLPVRCRLHARSLTDEVVRCADTCNTVAMTPWRLKVFLGRDAAGKWRYIERPFTDSAVRPSATWRRLVIVVGWSSWSTMVATCLGAATGIEALAG